MGLLRHFAQQEGIKSLRIPVDIFTRLRLQSLPPSLEILCLEQDDWTESWKEVVASDEQFTLPDTVREVVYDHYRETEYSNGQSVCSNEPVKALLVEGLRGKNLKTLNLRYSWISKSAKEAFERLGVEVCLDAEAIACMDTDASSEGVEEA